MMRICLLQRSKFFLLLEEKLNKDKFVKVVTCLPADLVLLDDGQLTQKDLVNILRELKTERVILVSEKSNNLNVFSLLDAGIYSIIPKNGQFLENSLEILNRIQHKEFFLPQEMVGELIERIIQMKYVEHDHFCYKVQEEYKVTLKQAEVASLMKNGHTNKEIANILGMSEGSVKVHVSQIYSKLGINDRTIAIDKLREMC